MANNARIQIKATSQDIETLRRAAQLKGLSLSDYVIAPARKRAEQAILDDIFRFSGEEFQHLLTGSSPKK